MFEPWIVFVCGLIIGSFCNVLIYRLSKGGMGGGDIKLIAMIGAFLGWQGAFFTILVGALTGSLVGIGLMLLGKKGRKDGAIVFTLVGDALIDWYIQLAF